MNEKILIIDDDLNLCNVEKLRLESEHYLVRLCHDGEEAIQLLKSPLGKEFDLIILDIILPQKNGFDVLKEIRQFNFKPIFILSARDSEGDRVSGLKMGADDYLTKPYFQSEFIERVNILLRRYDKINQNILDDVFEKEIIFKHIMISLRNRQVKINGQEIKLRAKEFDILFFLARNNGQVFTKKRIFDHVWKETYFSDEDNVMVQIQRLRKNLSKFSDGYEFIHTIWGVGYKFVGEE